MSTNFKQAGHTIVVSDIHLADAEPPHPKNPLWKRFKRPKYFVDQSFNRFLEEIQGRIPDRPIELVMNGDIFDFDSVMAIPRALPAPISWLERRRGLASEEVKSRFKMGVILSDHRVWVEALREFLLNGNRVVFVIGNHDVELHWLSVRQDLAAALRLPEELRENVRFCEWFYISNGDTLIEHGNQYDAYCLNSNPVNSLIKKGSRVYVRLPFGNLAGKYMLNGMGLMNPHSEASYIKGSLREYIVYYYKYVMTTQPFLLWTWFWSALVTLVNSVSEGLLPAMVDPLTIDARIEDIAARSNSDPKTVWSLKQIHAHAAIFSPWKILRELWLDRAVFLVLIVFASFQFFSFLNVFVDVSFWWFVVPVALLFPIFIFYARSVESEVTEAQKAAFEMSPMSARIARVRRVVHGHTHLEKHSHVNGVEYLNTGTWSPAFRDVECTDPYGRKCFAWIKPAPGATGERSAELYVWKDPDIEQVPVTE